MEKLKFILSVLVVAFGICACDDSQSGSQKTNPAETTAAGTEIAPDKIYYFYQNTCPHCHHAMEYINKKYPDLNMVMTNIANPGGYDLLVKCAHKFKLGNRVGTPLFCMGDNYLMGWSAEYERTFDEYVRSFVK